MFLTSTIDLEFDGLEFTVNVPGNDAIEKMWEVTNSLFKNDVLSIHDFANLGNLIASYITKAPENWADIPEISKTRLLFEIAKFITREALVIPDLKKK